MDTETKPELRKVWRERLQGYSPSDEVSQKIVDRISKSAWFQEASFVGLFIGRKFEPNLISLWKSHPKKCFFPRTTKETSALEYHEVTSLDILKPGLGGILEPPASAPPKALPKHKALILVPGLVFDGQGNRLGSGMGFYDRFFAGAPYCVKLGVCFSFQISATVLPKDKWDYPMDGLVTEEKTWKVK